MKTNQALAKRVRVTRRGKILARRSGQNHFKAKERRAKQLSGKRPIYFRLKKKAVARFLPYN